MHESEGEVTQSCPTLSDPMGCRPPGCSIHGVVQARALERAAVPSPVVLSRPTQTVSTFLSPCHVRFGSRCCGCSDEQDVAVALEEVNGMTELPGRCHG